MIYHNAVLLPPSTINALILNLDLIKNIDSHNATLPTPETKYELRQALFLKMKY